MQLITHFASKIESLEASRQGSSHHLHLPCEKLRSCPGLATRRILDNDPWNQRHLCWHSSTASQEILRKRISQSTHKYPTTQAPALRLTIARLPSNFTLNSLCKHCTLCPDGVQNSQVIQQRSGRSCLAAQ